MGSFANTVFSILLGWLQGLVAMIWSALTAEGGDAFLQFIAKNWIIIAVFLCAVGVIADFVVYFFRWEPYKVWKTFWRRIHNKNATENREEEAPAEPAAPGPAGRYFRPAAEMQIPGTAEETVSAETYAGEAEAYEELPEEEYAAEPEEMPQETDDLYRWREQPPEEREIPAEVTRAGYRVPADSPYRRPEDREGIKNRRRRIRLNLLGDSDEEDFHYVAPEPIVDQRQAYYAPVYPKNWTGEREDGEQDS